MLKQHKKDRKFLAHLLLKFFKFSVSLEKGQSNLEAME